MDKPIKDNTFKKPSNTSAHSHFLPAKDQNLSESNEHILIPSTSREFLPEEFNSTRPIQINEIDKYAKNCDRCKISFPVSEDFCSCACKSFHLECFEKEKRFCFMCCTPIQKMTRPYSNINNLQAFMEFNCILPHLREVKVSVPPKTSHKPLTPVTVNSSINTTKVTSTSLFLSRQLSS